MLKGDDVTTVRFTTDDEVELVGWFSPPLLESDVAVVHVHGMSGNGFENLLIDRLRASSRDSRAFFSFNNRGAGVVTWLNKSDGTSQLGGSCYESFDASARDIEAAIDCVEQLGFSRVILQGHSLGCTKIVHYLTTREDARVKAVVLLAPTDMRGWGTRTEVMRTGAAQAGQMVLDQCGESVVGEHCWDDGPLSARLFHHYTSVGSSADIYETKVAREIDVPFFVVYGTGDIGIVEIDGDIDSWRTRAEAAFPSHTTFEIIDGATHGFGESLDELASAHAAFLSSLL